MSTSPFDDHGRGCCEGRQDFFVLAFERAVVLAELERHDRHITQTAKALGLERSHLYKKCQQLGINLQSLPKHE